MPDDRFFHKRAGHSEKVNRLTDFEELIWRYYVLSSDDFGVMRFDHRQIQNDHERAGAKSPRVVTKALERVRDVELVHTFDHQGRSYCYSRNWQRFQKIEYPRETLQPCPPHDQLVLCEPDTIGHFATHPGGKIGREKKLQIKAEGFGGCSSHVSQISSEPFGEDLRFTRAGALAHAKAKAQALEGGPGETALSSRAGDFCEWYGDKYLQLLGVGYIGNPRKDYDAARLLCEKLTDQAIRDAAIVWFGADDDFAKNGTRTIPKFASRATGYLEKLKARGIV